MGNPPRLTLLVLLLAAACAGSSDTDLSGIDAATAPGIDGGAATPADASVAIHDAPLGSVPDGPVSASPDAEIGSFPDAAVGTADGGDDMGGGGLPPDPGVRFLTAPPGPACSADIQAHWVPKNGYSGGIVGTQTCGPMSPNCPTEYIPGNSGAPCTTPSDCTGPNPVCLTGPKYAGGTCSATGCELGSNFGCPAGGTCINGGDGQTYCLGGCGIDESGCFAGCARDGFTCMNTESRSLGVCLSVAGVRQCNPKEAVACTQPFGDGICVQTSWNDQTVGRCFETCDPNAQDCSRDNEGCYVLREYKGYPVCFQSWGFPENTECDRMTQCAEGLRCACDRPGESPCQTGLRCRRYCPLDGSAPCPDGTSCTPLAPGSRYGSCLPTP